MKRRQIIIATITAIIVADIALLISDRRFLVWERRTSIINTADGRDEGGYLDCTYWTGRSVRTVQFNYSDNNIMGRDQCPFVYNPTEFGEDSK